MEGFKKREYRKVVGREERAAINSRNASAQWAGHEKNEHEWATIRVWKDVREELCAELVRIGGTTRRGVAKPGQVNWSVFLRGLLKDAKAWRKANGRTK